MPKKLLKRYAPDPETIKKNKYLGIFARFLGDPNLFYMNRRSVSGAFASGLFWAMIPIPSQMVAATITAILIRVNLPISIALVWLTNPITIPPIFYWNYTVGTWLLGKPDNVGKFELSLEWIADQLDAIWAPLYAGSLLMGIICAIIGYAGMRLYWRWHVVQRVKKRRIRPIIPDEL